MAIAPFIAVPQSDTYWITNARLPLALLDTTVAHRAVLPRLSNFPFSEDLVAADVKIQAGRIEAIQPLGSVPAEVTVVDVCDGLIFPGFADLHIHLDKGFTWNRQPNPDGTFGNALEALKADTRNWGADDLLRRMDFGLRCSYAHGTQAVRTHFDAFGDMAEVAVSGIQQLQQDWRDRMTIQAASLVSLDYYLGPQGEKLADLVAEAGMILGGVAYTNPDLEAQIERIFALAHERNLAIDLHVDESLDADDRSLACVAETKLKRGYTTPVVCGHCCALSVQSSKTVDTTLQLVKEAEIGIVSLPMCNLFLQDRRPGEMPRYRGVTLLHEIRRQGIPLALASDNCRDAFHAYGDLDGLEVFAQSVKIGHLDRPIADWARAVTWTPADLMGLPQVGRIGIGQPANLVLFKARTFNELLCRPQSDRAVLRDGTPIDTTPPDYAELDDLLTVS